jgi:hypothetical protein
MSAAAGKEKSCAATGFKASILAAKKEIFRKVGGEL